MTSSEIKKEMKHTKPISDYDLDYNMRLEIEAANEYHRIGLHEIAKDEERHLAILKLIKKENEEGRRKWW